MRIILYAGKGGVGKTSVAAATGIISAQKGLKSLVMSLDPAHSLSDAFDLDATLMDKNKGLPQKIADNLWIQELDVHQEIADNWGEINHFIAGLINQTGIDDVLAEEMAVLPGMEELSALLHINRYAQNEEFDVVILDCAPTAESLHFVSLPKTLDWYMRKVFRIQRRVATLIRPVAKLMTDVPVPDDEHFETMQNIFGRIDGADQLLTDPQITSVRLVTNLEKMVLRETQRAFMVFGLHRLSIDAIIVNRVLPAEPGDSHPSAWQELQRGYLDLAESYFSPVPILQAPFYQTEVLGYDRLEELGRRLFADLKPEDILYLHKPFEFVRQNGRQVLRLHLPFAAKEEINLNRVGDELIIRLGNFKKAIILPRAFALLEPKKAQFQGEDLVIDFGGDHGQE